MEDRLNQQEANNASMINKACAELRTRILKALTDYSHGKVEIEVNHTPGSVTFIRSRSETTHK